MAESKSLDYLLRALQLLFAIVVMGTDGYAIHVFRGRVEHVNDPVFDGDADLYYGVPASWGFLMFCAAWTVLVVVFHLIAGPSFSSRALIGYIRIAFEGMAVLSWLAGFIAVAVSISSTDSCASGKSSCAPLKAAAVFGAFEWLLFMVTAAQNVMLVFNGSRKPKTYATGHGGAA